MRLSSAQQPPRLLQPALLAAEFREPDEAVPPLCRPPGPQVRGCPEELLLRLRPDAAPGEDAAVVRPTKGEERPQAGAIAVLGEALAPLRRPIVIAHALAGEDQIAAGEPDLGPVGHLAADGGGARLVQQPHPLLHAPQADERQALEGARGHLEVEIAERLGKLPRLHAQPPRLLGVLTQGPRRLAQRKPSMLRAALDILEQAARPLKPAVRHGTLAAKGGVVPGEPGGHPSRVAGATALAVETIRAFPSLEGGARVVEPPRGHRQALERLRALVDSKRLLEASSSFLPPAPTQGLTARRDRVGSKPERVRGLHGSQAWDQP